MFKTMKSNAAEYFRSLSPVKADSSYSVADRTTGLYEKTSGSNKSGRCHCCPYGYHIDLDFVRYCQALNQGAKNANPTLVQLKKLKKERRRQTKSIEAMLGIPHPEEDKAWFKEPYFTSLNTDHALSTLPYKKPVYPISSRQEAPTPPPREKKKFFSPPSPPPRKQSLTHPSLKSPPPPDIINSSNLVSNRRSEEASEALQEAVLDFEEAFESSREISKRKSRSDQHQLYPTIDLLHHTTPSYSQPYSNYYSKGTTKATVARSNSLPRQWKYCPKEENETCHTSSPRITFSLSVPSTTIESGYEGEMELVKLLRLNSGFRDNFINTKLSSTAERPIMMDTPYSSRQQYRDWNCTSGFSTMNGYTNSHQSPLISDAMAALNEARGFSSNQPQDFDTMSINSAMSGVSTTTLQSIREQMATGLSRLKELEEEVKGIPALQIKLDILKEEKRILMEQVKCLQKGEEPPIAPISFDLGDMSGEDLEGKLHSLKKYAKEKTRRIQRNRSISPMRVNLEDFHSYRRARRGSQSEGSDTESVHSYRGGRDKSRERDETRLFITESGDHTSDWRFGRKNAFSLTTTPVTVRKSTRDAAVSCKVVTRDVGVSHISPRSRSVGVVTDRVEDSTKIEIKTKPCMQCFRRNQKTFETKGVGTIPLARQDSGRLSICSISSESIGPEDLDPDNHSKNAILQKLGKRSPLISRLSSPQLFPPTLTFDNSTNTDPIRLRDQRLNTTLRMDELFTRQQLNESIQEAKKQWETTFRSRSASPLKEVSKKTITTDKSVQTYFVPLETKPVPAVYSIGIMAKPPTRDTGVGYASIHEVVEKKPIPPKTRSIACGTSIPPFERVNSTNSKSIGVGNCSITDETCAECIQRHTIHFRTVGCGIDRITDNICEKCSNKQHRNIGVGEGRITDETCKKCKLKRFTNVSCQAKPITHSISVEADIPSLVVSKESKDTSVVTTPEVERRPFGSSGVRLCDKCHEAITTVAKDIVNTSGSPSSSALPAIPSKIPRLVEHQQPEIKITSRVSEKTTISNLSAHPPPLPKSHNSGFSTQAERNVHHIAETQSSSFQKSYYKDDISTSSSVASSSLPSIDSSPQVKRVPYSRQDTYTKMGGSVGGFVNPAFEEHDPTKKDVADLIRQSPARKLSPEKLKKEKSAPEMKKPQAPVPAIKEQEEKATLSISTSSGSSSDEDDAADGSASVVASSIVTAETQATDVGEGDKNKLRKKSLPSREMKAALKVLNDSIGKPFRSGQQLTNAINIIQRDWLKISGQMDADPHAVEDYMDAFEEFSKGLLHRVVNLADINGNTAMHYAVSHGNFDVVSVLLDSKVCNVNHQNKAGYTAIMLVALAQIKNAAHASVVSKLFESGDVNIKASQHGQTALMLAVSHGRLDMVRMLISAGADPNIQDEDGSTALMCAAEHGHLAIVRYLAAQPDTDLYLMDNDGSTALTIAVEAGHKDVGVLLYKQMNLSRGSSPYGSMRGGKRPRTPTVIRASMTPPPRSSAPASPGRSRKSSGRVSPVQARQSSASLSNLNF